MRPECVIFDEPTAMLDPAGRADIMEAIEELHDDGITIILITHFMEEAARADRIVILDKGRVFMDGTPKEVFAEGAKLRESGLDLPLAVEIAEMLRKRGIKVPQDVVTEEELREYICQFR